MDISALITKTIAEKKPDEPRRYIGASGIGKMCSRAIWYGFIGTEQQSVPPRLRASFDIGKILEGLLLDYMEQAGLNIVRPTSGNNHLFYQDSEVPLFQGHADAILIIPGGERAIIEIKTAKSSSFAQFKNKGLRKWDETYFAQIQSYMGMSGYHKGVLVSINKDSSEIHHEWVDYDDIYYHELRCKAAVISVCEEPPEKINRSPIFVVCNMCSYKRVCHAGN